MCLQVRQEASHLSISGFAKMLAQPKDSSQDSGCNRQIEIFSVFLNSKSMMRQTVVKYMQKIHPETMRPRKLVAFYILVDLIGVYF